MQIAGAKWTEVLQATIAIIGFVLVIHQVWRLKRTVQGQTNTSLYGHYLKVNELLLQNPHLRPYFYEDKLLDESAGDPKDAHLRGEVEMMCEVIAGLLEHAVVQKDNLPADSWENCWKAYTHERFQRSGELRQYFKANQTWYAKSFCDVVPSFD